MGRAAEPAAVGVLPGRPERDDDDHRVVADAARDAEHGRRSARRPEGAAGRHGRHRLRRHDAGAPGRRRAAVGRRPPGPVGSRRRPVPDARPEMATSLLERGGLRPRRRSRWTWSSPTSTGDSDEQTRRDPDEVEPRRPERQRRRARYAVDGAVGEGQVGERRGAAGHLPLLLVARLRRPVLVVHQPVPHRGPAILQPVVLLEPGDSTQQMAEAEQLRGVRP